MPFLRQLFDFAILGRHRLENVRLIPLGATVAEAVALYGEPVKSGPAESVPGATEYTFAAGRYHEAYVVEWQGKIALITWWSTRASPARDLAYVFRCYQGGSAWKEWSRGYLYEREDGQVRLWCSAIAAIGVAHPEYLRAESAHKVVRSLEAMKDLADIHWAPNKAIEAMQAQFQSGNRAPLLAFAERSEKIAVSPDGGLVYVVRNHRAYDVRDGFMEMNVAPEEGQGCTQVINCFRPDSWRKAALPRDAEVVFVRFEGEACHLRLRRTTDGREFSFSAPSGILQAVLDYFPPGGAEYQDQALWGYLIARAEVGEDG